MGGPPFSAPYGPAGKAAAPDPQSGGLGSPKPSPDDRRRHANPMPSCPPKAPTAGLWDFGGRETPKPSGPAAWCQSDWGHSRDRYEGPRAYARPWIRIRQHLLSAVVQSYPLAGVGWSGKVASDRRAGLLFSRACLVRTLGPSPAPRNSPEHPTWPSAGSTCPCEKAS